MEENRLCTVGSCVPRSDAVESFPLCRGQKELVAGVAGRRLQRVASVLGQVHDRRGAGEEGQAKSASKAFHVLFVGVGFLAAQLVMEVGESERSRRELPSEEMGQCDRVGSATYGQQDSLAGRPQMPACLGLDAPAAQLVKR
jgi:hypothetical protein